MGLEQSQHIKSNESYNLFGNGEHGSLTNALPIQLQQALVLATDYTLDAGQVIDIGLSVFAQKEIVINGTVSINGTDGADGDAGGGKGTSSSCFFAQGLEGGAGGDNADGGAAQEFLATLGSTLGGNGGAGSVGAAGSPSIFASGSMNHNVYTTNPSYFLNPYLLMSLLTMSRPAGGGGGGGGDAGGNIGGGGGAGGGCIFLCAPIIRLGAAAELNAIGGSGGDGEADNSGGGGGAAGGFIVLIYEQLLDAGASFDVSAGTGGSAEGTGDNGVNGSDGLVFSIPTKATLA